MFLSQNLMMWNPVMIYPQWCPLIYHTIVTGLMVQSSQPIHTESEIRRQGN